MFNLITLLCSMQYVSEQDEKAVQKMENIFASLFAIAFVSALILLILLLRLWRRFKCIQQRLNELPQHKTGSDSQIRNGDGIDVFTTEKGLRQRSATGDLMDMTSQEQDVAFALITPTVEPNSVSPFDDPVSTRLGGLQVGGRRDLGRLSAPSLVSLSSSHGRSTRTGASGMSTEYYHRTKASTIPPKASGSPNNHFGDMNGGMLGHKPRSVNTVETVMIPITRVSSRDSTLPADSEGSEGLYTEDEHSETRSFSNVSSADGASSSKNDRRSNSDGGDTETEADGANLLARSRSQTASSDDGSLYDTATRKPPSRTPHQWTKSIRRR